MEGRYDYEELRAKAVAPDATQEDMKALADWFFHFDTARWNGECYDIGEGRALYPIYTETYPDEYEITGYEIR